ncbi:hypothetical protein GCM10010218_59610 [Streptomyces mashuensis]|uniref:Phage tail protein n=1 Tax=Streptomyces mashuensis TaxID=33904 RepID=A0A919EGC8_9ACTN|nr:phage tail protein [Streptomyces mashuensis]GHF70326.1 hypothetical protein GCM10010218_59610 [Streptomyces mashuensis]
MPPPPARPLSLPAVYGHDVVAQAFATALGEALGHAEERIDGLDAVLDPWRAPPAFLDWLIRITGARVEPGWTELQRRKAVDLAPRLAAYRGTRYGLLLEAQEIHGWAPPALVVVDPGKVFGDGDPAPPAGRMLTVTLNTTGTPARNQDQEQDEDEDPEQEQRALESSLARLVRAHCPAHIPFTVAVTGPGGS